MKHSRFGKALIYILFCVFLSSCAGRFDLSKHLSSQPPINYTARFNKNLPYKDLVIAIHLQEKSKISASKFKQYAEALYRIHKEAASFTFDELNFPNEIRSKVLNNLSNNKKELANYYLSELKKRKPYEVTSGSKEQVLTYPYYTSVNKFADVASSNITFILNTFLGFITDGMANKITLAAVTKPFQIMLYQALLPIVEAMRNEALLMDHVNARIKIKNHLRKIIAQLATVEDSFTTEEEIHPTRRFLIFKSQADIICQSTARVKAGFDLIKKFIIDIKPETKSVNVYLPKPEIVSFDVYTEYKSINDGLLIDADETHINELQKLTRERLKRTAIESGILNSAKKNVSDVINRILQPMMQTPYFSYKIKIYFD